MSVYGCATPDCARMISESILPGGSPVALADPERWSLFGFFCPSCKTLLCDRCATRRIGVCACGQSLQMSIRPRPSETAAGDAVNDVAPAAQAGRAQAFALAIAAQVGGEVVDYSTVDFGRERKPGQRTLLLDRDGRREGERAIALVRHLRRMGLPPGVQVFANTLRDLGDAPEHRDRDQVVFVASSDPFDVIRVAEVDPANHDLTAEDVAERLAAWHAQYGIEIVAADSDTVVLRFLRLPDDHGALIEEIIDFCPDIAETFELDPDALAKSPWVWLWWD